MNRAKIVSPTFVFGIVAAMGCFIFSGCEYDVPITPKPTRTVDVRLLGDWTAKNGTSKLKIVRLDESNYIVYLGPDDGELYRVYHSDVDETALVSVQQLDSKKRKYAYWAWKLSDDGTLLLRNVNDKVVPDETKDSASVQELIKKNIKNPALFEEDETQFTKNKSPAN